jgi:hypothetical protein
MKFTALERQLAPFLAVQASLSTLVGFGAVLVYAEAGMAATVHYTLLMLTVTMAGTVLAYASGRRWRVDARRLVRAAFALPGVLLWWADGQPAVLAVAVGGFLGLSWGARLWIELSVLDDTGRDGYAAHATVLSVVVSLLTTLAASLWLTLWGDERGASGLYGLYAGVALLGLVVAAQRLPDTPPLRLHAPLQVLRQREYVACLPLYFLESGLLGIGVVMSASGAIEALGKASHYGWVATLATLAGAIALYTLRHRRQAHNRDGWMGLACLGITAAYALLGASAWLPALYVLHLLLHAGTLPFWLASEQVLNQRTLDIHGALADRIAVREATLWFFRVTALTGFWFAARQAEPAWVLATGAGLMCTAALLEYAVGRAWLRRAPAAAPAVLDRGTAGG